PMLRVEAAQLLAGGHLEVGEVEAGGDGAAGQRERVRLLDGRAEEVAGRDDRLGGLPAVEVAADAEGGGVAQGVDDVDGDRGAGVGVPDLVLADAVQRGEVLAAEEEVDGGRERAVAGEPGGEVLAGDGFGAAVRLTVEAALRVWGELQAVD